MIEKMKKDKLKTVTVLVAIIIFVVGLIAAIVNSGDTYAASTASCYQCNDNSNLLEYTSSTPSHSDCHAGWHVNSSLEAYYCYSYVVAFDANGGSGAPSTIYKPMDVDITLPTTVPTRSGYTFIEWNLCEDGTCGSMKPGEVYSRNYSLTFYAIWKENSCYECNSPSNVRYWTYATPSDENCPSGWHVNSSLNETSCVGATYSCYECNSPSAIKTWGYSTPTDSNCPSGWHVNSNINKNNCAYYTLTYDAKGGSGAPNDAYKSKGINVTISDTKPTRNGYTFLGWDTSFTAATVVYQSGDSFVLDANTTLYAVWSANYTISYDAKGGSGAPSSQTKIASTALTLSSTVPTKSGYTFLGWDTSFTAATVVYKPGDTYTSNGDVTLYAVWQEQSSGESGGTDTPTVETYTVSYSANGGSGTPSSQTANVGSGITLSSTVPTRTGYEFQGWGTSAGATSVSYSAGSYYSGGSTTLYAVWNPITYTVVYNANGGLGITANSSHTYDVSKKLTKNGFSMTGYTFVGWSTTIDGNASLIDEQIVSNLASTKDATINLYAQWKVNTYNIKYDTNGGTVTGNPNSATYNEVFTINHPTRSVTVYCNSNKTDATIGENPTAKFVFVGWTSNDIDTNNAYHGDVLWNDKSTLVTDTQFKNLSITNGGTVTLVANWDDASVKLPSVTKDGYTCNWNTKATGKGDSYKSGEEYIVSTDSTSVNLYAICEVNSKSDEELSNGPTTGDTLIYVVWVVGVGALGYSVYYFMKRRNNM